MHMPEKFTVGHKEQIIIESFTATNIAELCRRHGAPDASLDECRVCLMDGEGKGLGKSQKGNEYKK